MISIHVGHDGAGGFTFALSPLVKERGFPNRVFVTYERGTQLTDFKDRWPAIASMLVGCTMNEMEQKPFQIVEMPDETIHPFP